MSIRFPTVLLLSCITFVACKKPTVNQPLTVDPTTVTEPDATTTHQPAIYKLDNTERIFCGWHTYNKGGSWGSNDSTWVDSFYLYFKVAHNKTIMRTELKVFKYQQGVRDTAATIYTQDTTTFSLYPNTVHYIYIHPTSHYNIYFDTLHNKVVSYKTRNSYGGNGGHGVSWGDDMSEK